MKRLLLLLLFVGLVVFYQDIFTWCAEKLAHYREKPVAVVPKDESFKVAVSFPPTAYFARRVGGQNIRVLSPLPSHVDPASWVPTAAEMEQFFKADLILLSGAGLERWTNIYATPEAKTLRLADGFKDQWILNASGSPDAHIWLDPQLAIREVEMIRDALVLHDNTHSAQYTKNAAELREELEALDAQLKLLPFKTVFAASPEYAYLAKRYGWKLISLDLSATSAPTAQQMERVSVAVKQEKQASIILWNEQPFTEAELQMSRLALTNVVFETGARSDQAFDFLALMRMNLEKLRETTR